jgi:hypothetical protein
VREAFLLGTPDELAAFLACCKTCALCAVQTRTVHSVGAVLVAASVKFARVAVLAQLEEAFLPGTPDQPAASWPDAIPLRFASLDYAASTTSAPITAVSVAGYRHLTHGYDGNNVR